MSAFLVFLGILLAILVLLLWLPIGIHLNSDERYYFAHYGPLVQAQAIPDPNDVLLLQLKVLFWKKKWSILELRNRQKRKKKPKVAQKKKQPRYSPIGKSAFSPAKIRRLLRSFRIREFRWELDTGNPVLNAKLYPFFYLTGYRFRGTDLNFEGRNSLLLRVENRPIRILTAWIQS